MIGMAVVALALIALSAVVQAVALLRKEPRLDPISHWLLGAASALLFATRLLRSIRIGFVAVTNTYESLVFFSAVICAILLALRLTAGKRPFSPLVAFGATIVCLALLMISSSPIAPKDIQPPIPALQSIWLVLHVTLAFIGESFFVVSFVAALTYLGTKSVDRRADMDRLMASSIGIGYPIFTAGALIFGAIWAETAWGRWWGWDPKETWALITWLLYTAFLHTRLVKKLRGRTTAVLALVGFVATVFTYFGVNFLLAGLHSYG
jgi:ABC-type transport system involved in cytochrome c biogenesis permease subunit